MSSLVSLRPSSSPRSRSARLRGTLLGAVLPIAAAAAPLGASDVPDYVAKPDASTWEIYEPIALPSGSGWMLRLHSQTWQGIPWKHWLAVIRPETIRNPDHALLLVTGGSTSERPSRGFSRDALLLSSIANQSGSVIAVLGQVPNQPLFDNLKEDALIAYTFRKTLETGDESWPCLLPMVKSARRAMDAVQELTQKELGRKVEKFVVTGASKRGWTTWLTGAMDPRVVGIAPMVIDTLNMRRQMAYQIESWGDFSEQIHDYIDLGLHKELGTPASDRLLALVDPYSFRDRLALPKLIIMGTNDRYWPLDAARHYFDDLPGEKHLYYVANAGHGLDASVVGVVSGFYRSIIDGLPRPSCRWRFEEADGKARLHLELAAKPSALRLFSAASPTRDFRDAKWTAKDLEAKAGAQEVALDVPASGFAAYYAEAAHALADGSGLENRATTIVRIVGAEAPLAPKAPAGAGGGK